MKLTLICLSIFVVAASAAPQFPASGSPLLLPVQPCAQAQDESGHLIPPGGLVLRTQDPGSQDNIEIGSWPRWLTSGFLDLPGTGVPVAPVEPPPTIEPDNDESKPMEWTSCTPTVAERSRCDYRKKEYDGPRVELAMVKSDVASENEFPFLVALVKYNDEIKDYSLNCGGSLISPTKILTAAHCVTNPRSTEVMDGDQFQVRLGMHFINDTSNDAQLTRNVIKIKIHEEYDNSNTENDIAILTMDEPVEYTNTIQPICLVPDCLNDDNELQVTAMGWGNTEFEGNVSDVLRYAEFTTVPNDKCQETHSNLVNDQMLCAYNNEGKGPCQGDSGGPLVIEVNEDSDFENSCHFMQVGIVSWGIRCAEKESPGVYTRVKNYWPWISANSE